MSTELSLKEIQKEWHGTLKSYVIGFFASLIMTIVSFMLVVADTLPSPYLAYTIVALAVLQAVVQLIFFLHVGQEAKPQWETFVFYFMVLILLIIALGSLWIMNDLDYRMMSNMNMEISHD